jgi:hypothetical protein
MKQVKEKTDGSPEAHDVESVEQFLASFGDPNEVLTVEKSITLGDRQHRVFIKCLSFLEAAHLRAQGGAPAVAWLLENAVLTNAGTKEAPVYEPFFTSEQVRGRRILGPLDKKVIVQKLGLLDNRSDNSREFLDAVLGAIWEVNQRAISIAGSAHGLLGGI